MEGEEVSDVDNEETTAPVTITESIPVGQTVTFEEDVEEKSVGETPQIEDIPLEIKNYPSENLPKDTNKGEQLGLF
jgi:hypothetical protein